MLTIDTSAQSPTPGDDRPRLVILGGGVAAVEAMLAASEAAAGA